MLVNLTPNLKEIERRKNTDFGSDFEYIPQNDIRCIIEKGIYQPNFGCNFSHDEFIEFEGMANIPLEYSYTTFDPSLCKVQYGVADTITQIKEYYKDQIEDPISKYFIYVTPIFQNKQNKGLGGGRRWHKWGEYIGTLEPKREYLDDEDFGDDFKQVLCFHICKVPE